MEYKIITVSDPAEITNAPVANVDGFRLGLPGYEPKTTARLVYIKDKGFLCRMESFETDLKADCHEEDGDTYKDNCMEWFINFNPALSDCYLNFEANSIGVLHVKWGNDENRITLDRSIERPTAKAVVYDDHWTVDYFISLHTISQVFHVDSVKQGDVYRGNFFKCGDETEKPHYGMWTPVTDPDLSFHTPEHFGTFVLQ